MGKEYKVVEVNAGICTCTIRGVKVQETINKMAQEGWEFKQYETIMGRRFGCVPAPMMLICFEK